MYQPKTGASCHCRRGIERDNCPNCEGTGKAINFALIRARKITQQTIDEETHKCPMCINENDNKLLGILGNRVHLRCGACGFDHSYRV